MYDHVRAVLQLFGTTPLTAFLVVEVGEVLEKVERRTWDWRKDIWERERNTGIGQLCSFVCNEPFRIMPRERPLVLLQHITCGRRTALNTKCMAEGMAQQQSNVTWGNQLG